MPALRTPTVSSSGTALCTIVPAKPTRRSASAAITCAASPLFMSAAPRPKIQPSISSPPNGSRVQSLPTGTTS